MSRRLLHFALLALACRPIAAPVPSDLSRTTPAPAAREDARFTVVVLGAQGGLVGDDLSAYLVAARGSAGFVCLDAGTLYTGLARAAARGAFPGLPRDPGRLLRDHVRAYLLSHPHLDHLAGLVLAAPDDAPGKPIAGLAPTLAALQGHLFNHAIWPNFADAGAPPALARYTLLELPPERPVPLPAGDLSVEAWPLSHAGSPSTAFLLQQRDGSALLYLGDTGPDAVERTDRLARLWRRIAPRIRTGTLRALFVEVSYPDPRPDEQLFGHLTPKWLAAELAALAALVDPNDPAALRTLTVVVTHIKPSPTAGPDPRAEIQTQLARTDTFGARLVYPHQGDRLEF